MALTKVTEKIISDNLSISGIASASNFKTGTTNVHNVGVELAGINVLGANTPIGTGATIYNDGGARFSGIVSATSFVGSGANLTGVASTDNIKTSTTANFTGGIQVGGATTLTGALSVSGNLGVGGVLTYEDVTNIDSVGVITARSGVKIGPTAGVAGTFFADGSYVTAGVVTATTFHGSGANLTGISADVVDDTSPQLGANLDTNSKCIDFGDSNTGTVNRLRFGASTDLEIFHNGTNNHIDCHTAGQDLYIRPTKDVYFQDYDTDDKHVKMVKDGAVELYHNNVLACETSANGLAFPNGKGIDFSATSNPASPTGVSSELFDDYEEGGWTPSCNVGTVAVASAGVYVKVGRMVHLTVLLYNFSNTSSSTSILISGVPYACSGQYIGSVWLRRTNIEGLSYKCTIGDSGNSIINISYDSNGNGNNMGGALTYSKFAHSTPYMNITLTYQTA